MEQMTNENAWASIQQITSPTELVLQRCGTEGASLIVPISGQLRNPKYLMKHNSMNARNVQQTPQLQEFGTIISARSNIHMEMEAASPNKFNRHPCVAKTILRSSVIKNNNIVHHRSWESDDAR